MKIVTLLHCYIVTLSKLKGFSLIEMLIVLSILGIAATLVTTSYRSFERRQRVKDAVLEMKSQIRSAQNKALSGDKGIVGDEKGFCSTGAGNILIGWFVNISQNESSYKVAGDCQVGTSEVKFGEKIVKLPEEVKIEEITYNRSPKDVETSINVLYRPLENDARFFLSPSTPSFINQSTGQYINLLGGSNSQESVTITLKGFGVLYEVTIQPTGEVNEKEI